MTDFTQKVAVITGGASGIGRATAEKLAMRGAKVVVSDINPAVEETATELSKATGSEVTHTVTNVAKPEDIQAMIHHALDKFGRVDILMNNAGFSTAPAPIHATDDDDWSKVLDVCLKGVFLGTKYVLPLMMEQQQGNIINVASIAGVIAAPSLAAYGAAKAGVIGLTKTTVAEYSRYNIRCNCIAPGWTKTSMVDEYIRGDDKTRDRMLRGVPMRRFGEVDEIAEAALFLAGDDVQFMQGQTMVLDGGITII